MEIKSVDFYYFSGTGNTLLIIQKMEEVFISKGLKVNLFRIEKTKEEDLKKRIASINPRETIIGLGFTVAYQGTFSFVWDFVKIFPKLDKNNKIKIFMMDSMAGFSGGVVGPMKKILKSKNYDTIGAKEFVMPDNLYQKIDKAKNEKKVKKSLKKAEQYALDILNERTKWTRFPLISDFMSIVSKRNLGRRLFYKIYPLKVDNAKCTKCGICVELCPVDNITMPDYTLHGDECVYCMRCIAFCPSRAIYIPKKTMGNYRAVKYKDLLR